jgi:DNA-binding beta-propeller fold protein YncE
MRSKAAVFSACAAGALLWACSTAQRSLWPTAHGQELQKRNSLLLFETKIPLGSVAGRIDHMAIDAARSRLFVAELGNNTVGIVDLDGKQVVHRIGGLSEPQGITYVPLTDSVFVANGGDGSVRVFRGSDYAQVARIELGGDADNVRFDANSGKVFVGFGGGGIAIVDPMKNQIIGKATLPVHPESFQIEPSSGRLFINLPNASSIASLSADLKALQDWKVAYSGNFAMTLDPERGRVIVVFRRPTRLVAYDDQTGRAVAEIETCGDVDDMFQDSKNRRVYVVCGSGAIDVLETESGKYSRIGQITTVAGARTGLFVPNQERLLVAARGHGREGPAIWSYRVNAGPH